MTLAATMAARRAADGEEPEGSDSPEDAPRVNDRSLNDMIFQKGILIDFMAGIWTGRTRMKAEDLDMEESAIPASYQLGSIILIDKKRLQKPATIHAVTRRSLEEMTAPFHLSRARYCPFGQGDRTVKAVRTMLQRRQAEFIDVREKFIEDYPYMRNVSVQGIVNDVSSKLPGVDIEAFEERLRAKYPDVEALRKSFKFDWSFFQIDVPHELRIRSWNEKAREQLDESMREWVSEMMTVMRDRVNKVAQHMAEVMGKAKTPGLPERSRKSILKEIEQIEGLNFYDDPEAARVLRDLRTEVENDWPSNEGLRAVIDTASRFAEAEMDGALDTVVRGLIGDSNRVVEV